MVLLCIICVTVLGAHHQKSGLVKELRAFSLKSLWILRHLSAHTKYYSVNFSNTSTESSEQFFKASHELNQAKGSLANNHQ